MPKLSIQSHTEVMPNRVSVSCDLDREMPLNEKQAAQLDKKLIKCAVALIREFDTKSKKNKKVAAATV